MLKRMMEIETLDSEDKKIIVYMLDSLIRNVKAKKVFTVSP